jgi:hypothetical protein
MISMHMSEFLIAARGSDRAAGAADTIPLEHTMGMGSVALPIGDKAGAPRTDSDRIVVRFGSLKGVRNKQEAQALYFPIECGPLSVLHAFLHLRFHSRSHGLSSLLYSRLSLRKRL